MSERLFRLFLSLYPASFRHAFADEMVDVFSRRRAAVREQSGWLGVWSLWLRTLAGLVRAGCHERFRAGTPNPKLPRKDRNPMDRLLQDFRYALRMLTRSPGFTAVAVLTLGIGIGVNTAVFSLVNAFLLRPLPHVEDPDRLVVLFTGDGDFVGVSAYMDYLDFRERADAVESFAAYKPLLMDLSGTDSTERIDGAIVTANYFDVLGVEPARGRFFAPNEDDEPGAETVAVIGFDLWQSRFGADPGAVGRSVRLNGLSFTVIGVAPQGFRGTILGSRPQVFAPMMMQPHFMPSSGMLLDRRGWGGIYTVGRLARGVSLERARDDVAAVAGWLEETYPDQVRGREYVLEPLSEATLLPSMRGLVVRLSGLLLAIVGVVLLVACVNVANLMLSRAVQRRPEIAVRQALGAGRPRLVRQLLVESLTLSVFGGAVGLALALASHRFLRALPFPFELDFGIDLRMIAFATAATFITGIGFGVAPALRATSGSLRGPMSGAAGGRRPSPLLANGLVVAQVALSLVLAIAAGLFGRTLLELGAVELGFDANDVLIATVDPALQGYEGAEIGAFYDELLERTAVLPGAHAASVTSLPPAAGADVLTFDVAGFDRPEGGLRANIMMVGADYFATMAIPLSRGRGFATTDDPSAERVLVVNARGAVWLEGVIGRDPVGAGISFEGPEGPFARIVGVVADSKTASLRDRPEPMFYLPHRQTAALGMGSRMTLLIRHEPGAADRVAASLRGALRQIDPNVPLYDVGLLRQHLAEALVQERVTALVSGFAALLSVALASVGLYGVLSYSVARRTNELGIRMALGARATTVRAFVVRQGFGLVALGAAVGLVISLATASLLSGFVYGVATTDITTYAGVLVLLVVVALAASYVPARRATRVDPITALRRS